MVVNLLCGLPDASKAEIFTDLLVRPGCRIERIVSHGQVTPADRPYVQAHDEWVMVLAGRAQIDMGGETLLLEAGACLLIPAGAEHRVAFTDLNEPTVWLAVHMGEEQEPTASCRRPEVDRGEYRAAAIEDRAYGE